MRIALPIWDGRISPVFDVARHLLLVDLEGGIQIRQGQEVLTQTNPAARAECLADLGVDVLICGAISWPLEAMLTNAGIRVMPYVCGQVDQILRAFASGQLNVQDFLMPGCRGRGGRRFRGPRGRFRGRHGRGKYGSRM